MEDQSRRDLFKIILTTAGAGAVSPALAQHVHTELAAASKPVPKAFTAHNLATLRKLSDLIIPGSNAAGAPEFIDFLAGRNQELLAIFNGGLAWVDTYMRKTHGADFLSAKPEQQTELLDKLAWQKNHTPETAPGVPFWTWARNMVVDAYYTSPAGVKDIGYMGNGAMSAFTVPKEAVDYVMSRSPLA